MASKEYAVEKLRMVHEGNENEEGDVSYYRATQNGKVGSLENVKVEGVGYLGKNGIDNNYVPSNNSKPFPKSNIKTPLLFQFTRHATSCFNIEVYPPEGKGNLRNLGMGGIPSLPNYGIINTIALANKNKGTSRFQSPIISVSNLIRTWMTAVLLYAFSHKDSDKETITLRICPHLRETGWEGNKAYSLTDSIPKFVSFLKLINTTFSQYRKLREIILLIPNNTTTYSAWIPITITIPTYDITPSICDIVDPLLEKGYVDDGNIDNFMKWYNKSLPKEQGTVHVVAHSGIMKTYVKKICNGYVFNNTTFDMKKYSVDGILLEVQNCWSFTTQIHTVPDELLKSIQPGYKNPKGTSLIGAQTEEIKKGSKSLCLEPAQPIVCPKKGGKRRTKKNRKSCRMRRRLRRTRRRS
jgi:hypothetical protein